MSVILIIFFIFFNLFPVFGLDLPISQIADDSYLRVGLKNDWFTDAPPRVLMRRTVFQSLQNGERVQISTQEGGEEFLVLISREMMGGRVASGNNPAIPRRGTGRFPGYAQGSWMLTRNKESGAGTLIRIFLRSDQHTYIQFHPFGEDKSIMDVILYSGYVVRALPIAVSFERLYTMQLNDIIRLAGNKFPQRYFEPDLMYYRNSRTFVAQVRGRLSGLQFTDDGAIDENGEYVFIETLQGQPASSAGLNCSGFTKWLIDGMLRPVTGTRLSIAPLKAPFGDRGSSFTEMWEERRDPYFGLDWIRNLASEANKVLRSPSYSVLEEFEVRADNFSFLMGDDNRSVPNSYPGFLGEAGYGVEGLSPLLYTLAINEPFSFYLAAVSDEKGAPVTPQNMRGAPRLRQYYHVAALVPYFDEYGVFKVVVFESAEETSFSAFRGRYPNQFVNLVQVPVVTAFDP